MFTWICPKCGKEVPPAYSECPNCPATAEAQPAPAPPAQSAETPQQAPVQKAPAPAAVKAPTAPKPAKDCKKPRREALG